MMKRLIPMALGMLLFLSMETMPVAEAIYEQPTEIIEETEIEVLTLELPTVTEPQTETEIETEEPQEKLVYLGEFKVTAYCACMKCCGKTDGITATGTKATQGRTIAVDPKVIPYGMKVMFNGNTYVAEDCGGSIKQNKIDLYFDSHQDALDWGVQYHEVYIITTEEL